MSKHTPGPYEARFVDGGMPSDCCEYGVISLSEGREVCRVWREQDARAIASSLLEPGDDPNTDATYEQAKTNARLIAAAPDMLEALRRFEASYPGGINPWLDEAASLARAAIAKAEGKE